MIPDLFRFGPIPIHSFGLMLVCALLLGWKRYELCLRQCGERAELAEPLVFAAGVGGIIGARILYLISFPSDVMADPIGTIFGGAGFVFFGGFLGGMFAVWWVIRKERVDFLRYGDLAGPALSIGYGIGRIGCQLSGDGDYGKASNLPWAIGYPLGVIPTSPGITVHPTPVYETLLALGIAGLLLYLRKHSIFSKRGQQFGIYLILTAITRFCIEYLRIEPVILFGLTEAQLISIGLVMGGTILVCRYTVIHKLRTFQQFL